MRIFFFAPTFFPGLFRLKGAFKDALRSFIFPAVAKWGWGGKKNLELKMKFLLSSRLVSGRDLRPPALAPPPWYVAVWGSHGDRQQLTGFPKLALLNWGSARTPRRFACLHEVGLDGRDTLVQTLPTARGICNLKRRVVERRTLALLCFSPDVSN